MVRIIEFPKGRGRWRVDFLGGVERDSGSTNEVRITLAMTELLQRNNSGELPVDERSNHLTLDVDICQLYLFPIGSIWSDSGRDISFDLENRFYFSFDTHNISSTKVSGNVSIDETDYVAMPRYQYPLGENFRHMANARLVSIQPSHPPFEGCKVVLIPEVEILRFYYFSSSDTFRLIWDGNLSAAIDSAKSGLLEGGDVRVHLRKDFVDEEAWFIARWLSSAVMQEQVRRIHGVIAAATANQTYGSRKTHIEAGFPFCGNTKLIAKGKPIRLYSAQKQAGQKSDLQALLVTEIVNCSHPHGFRNVIVERDNDGRKAEDFGDEDKKIAFMNSLKKPNVASSDEVVLQSSEAPSFDFQKTSILDIQDRFSFLSGKELIKEPKEVQKYESAKILRPAVEIAELHSTGETLYGATGIGAVTVVGDKPAPKPEASLQNFLDALELIKRHPAVLDVKLLSLTDGPTVEGLYLFRYSKGMRSWHWVNGHPRRAAIAEIRLASRTIYVLELERNVGGQAYSTLILENKRGALSTAELKAFMREVAGKGWPSEEARRDLTQIRIKHMANDDQNKFAQKILRNLGVLDI